MGDSYRILLADDEGIVTDSLKYIIEKRFDGECALCTAKNGKQAIELAETFRPDIVFLDINMPGINGLKAMREIRAQNPGVKIVLLTAYDNADYVKEALRLGAAEYLMKPINKAAIIDQLSSLMHLIDEERRKRLADLEIREKMGVVEPIIENAFVLSFVINDGYDAAEERFRELLNIQEDYGFIALIEWGDSLDGNGVGNPVGASVLGHKCYGGMSEIVKTYMKAFVSAAMGSRIICSVPVKKPELEYDERLSVIKKANELSQALRRQFSMDFRVGIGNIKPWKKMTDSYREALNALRRGVCTVNHAGDITTAGSEERRRGLGGSVLDSVSNGIEYNAKREAEFFAEWALQNNGGDLRVSRVNMLEILLMARRAAGLRDSVGEDGCVLPLLDSSSPDDMKRLFVSGVCVFTQAAAAGKRETDTVIIKAIKYMQRHYNRDLSLTDVARMVNISPHYFSKLFKEETGSNYSDYLTHLRIEAAKLLLPRQDMSVKRICVEIGYSDPNYFSRIFKRCTGMTPSEFRESH